MPCANDALVKIKTPTGWLNVCLDCYDDYYRRRAAKTCEALGLHTAAEKRAWVLAQAKRLAERWSVRRPREPGDDEAEA